MDSKSQSELKNSSRKKNRGNNDASVINDDRRYRAFYMYIRRMIWISYRATSIHDLSRHGRFIHAPALTPALAFKPHESIMLQTLDIFFSMIVIVRRRL